MSAIFKTLTGIIPSNQTAIVFTDNMIVEDSILDVFFSNDDIVVDDMTMSGNSVTVTISPQNYNVGVALFINNCEVFTPYDDTEVLNRLTIVETDTDTLNTEIVELDTEVGELNTELDTLTNTVNNKQDRLPDIVNDRYLHTNATTGDLEWVSVQSSTSNIYKIVRNVSFNGGVGNVSIPDGFTMVSAYLDENWYLIPQHNTSLMALRFYNGSVQPLGGVTLPIDIYISGYTNLEV